MEARSALLLSINGGKETFSAALQDSSSCLFACRSPSVLS